jgi:hypothetical protein
LDRAVQRFERDDRPASDVPDGRSAPAAAVAVSGGHGAVRIRLTRASA